jgi:hypothetical protein
MRRGKECPPKSLKSHYKSVLGLSSGCSVASQGYKVKDLNGVKPNERVVK